jgi:hypothetical protein
MEWRTGLAGILVVLALCAAACGSGAGNNATISIKTLRSAATKADAATSKSFDLTETLSVKGKKVEVKGSGVASSDGRAHITLKNAGVAIEERVTADGLYLDFGNSSRLADLLPAGKHWVFVSYDALSKETGTDLRALIDQSKSSSPSQGLEYLQATSGDVQKIGDDTVGGAHATHYVTTIDYVKYAAEKLANAKPELREKIAALGKVPADVWIDDSDRVVKTHFAIDGSAVGGPGRSVELTLQITGFDVPVDVVAPPADEVIDVSDLASLAGASDSTL